jgi:predicted metal-dependent hydrolase
MRQLIRRRVDFEFDAASVPRDWYRGDLHLTHFWNALSLLFPEGEGFFVRSVRRYRDKIHDPALLEQVDAFIGQEAMHGKAHRAFNELVRSRGLGVAEPAEEQLRRLLAFARRSLSRRGQLAVTCALEHFTAILAEQLLRDEEHRGAGHPSVRPLWLWHALEESEHKAVAFDVYERIGGSYGHRVAIMLLTTAFFFGETANVYARFLAAEGELWNVRGWARALRYFWVEPGLLRKLAPAWLDYFRPGFHPDDRDTDALLESWRGELFGPGGQLEAQWRQEAAA